MAASGAAERGLKVLREVLGRDYLGQADIGSTLRDLAQMVRSAVDAQEGMVAIWSDGRWDAMTSAGKRVKGDRISGMASLSVLERVRESGRPELTTGSGRVDARSPSVHVRGIEGFLVVPFRTWDVKEERPVRTFGGCLYAHRTSARGPFGDEDVAIVTDLARIAEPILGLLRHVSRVEGDLEVSRAALEEMRRHSVDECRLGNYATRDPWFAKNVLEPLRRASAVDKVGLLILGPTGSGKSHLAEAYHNESPRRTKSFVALNCGSFRSAAILGPELFGFAPDSGYQNAPHRGRPGKALLASGGTLFLDEVGCLPMELQPQLLRLVEKGRYTPLGGNDEVQVDLQVIAATNEDLAAAVRSGAFREDLYWRLCDVVVTLPPLSDRPADLDALATELLRRAVEKTRRTDIREISPEARLELCKVDWSRAGNVRGLEKTIERSVILAPQGTRLLSPRHLVMHGLDLGGPAAPAKAMEPDQLADVVAAIKKHRKATNAAKALGLTYRELYWRLQKAGLSVNKVLLDRG